MNTLPNKFHRNIHLYRRSDFLYELATTVYNAVAEPHLCRQLNNLSLYGTYAGCLRNNFFKYQHWLTSPAAQSQQQCQTEWFNQLKDHQRNKATNKSFICPAIKSPMDEC